MKKIRKGFTLVELIIVIAIIAILAGAIFVAIDPARRLHESRNARRQSDISTIASAVKTYQADNAGTHYATIAALTAGEYYEIGTQAGECGRVCAGIETNTSCVNLSGIGSAYLATIPYDPQTGDDEQTSYAIVRDANGAITVQACDAEAEGPGGAGDVPVIKISR